MMKPVYMQPVAPAPTGSRDSQRLCFFAAGLPVEPRQYSGYGIAASARRHLSSYIGQHSTSLQHRKDRVNEPF